MRHILRHGHGVPTIQDLDLWQIGINEDDNCLYAHTKDGIVQLNDNAVLEQQEIRTWRFTDDGKIDDGKNFVDTTLVKGIRSDFSSSLTKDIRLLAEHDNWNVTKIKFQLLEDDEPIEFVPDDAMIEVFTIKGETDLEYETDDEGHTTVSLPVNNTINEWIVSVSEAYAFKICVYKSQYAEGEVIEPSEDRQYQSLIVVESLGFLSEGGIIL